DREAELRVELARRDVLVGVRPDAGRHPDLAGQPPAGAHHAVDEVELVEAVDHQRGAGPPGRLDILRALVVAEEMDPLGRVAGAKGDLQLAGGDDVQAEALRGDHAKEAGAAECLRGVEDLAAVSHRLDVLAAADAYGLLVVDVERGAVRGGQVEQVAATNLDVATIVHPVRDRMQGRGLPRPRPPGSNSGSRSRRSRRSSHRRWGPWEGLKRTRRSRRGRQSSRPAPASCETRSLGRSVPGHGPRTRSGPRTTAGSPHSDTRRWASQDEF